MKKYLEEVNKGLEEKYWKVTCFLFESCPEQNPVEDIWLKGKNFLRRHFYQNKTFQQVKDSFFNFLNRKFLISISWLVLVKLHKSFRRAIAGLLMVMTLALMVYNVAQRRVRNAMDAQNETIPNQIGKKVRKPTLRWIFQTFEGINFVKTITGESVQCIIHGINDLHKKVIRLLGGTTCAIYQVSTN